MIYLRVKPRAFARENEPLTLGDVADVICDASLRLAAMPVETPRGAGVWPLDALRLAVQLQSRLPGETVNVLGCATGWLVRKPARKRARFPFPTTALLFFAALAGCLLLCFFPLRGAWHAALCGALGLFIGAAFRLKTRAAVYSEKYPDHPPSKRARARGKGECTLSQTRCMLPETGLEKTPRPADRETRFRAAPAQSPIRHKEERT